VEGNIIFLSVKPISGSRFIDCKANYKAVSFWSKDQVKSVAVDNAKAPKLLKKVLDIAV